MTVERHRLLLLRHGETEWSLSGRHTGRTDLELTDVGRDQARLAADALGDLRLRDPLVVCSPRHRALVTAELAGLTVDEVNPLLAEWDYGDYEGLTTSQIREQVPDWLVWTHGCPGGESPQEVTARADRAIAVALQHMVERDVVFVGHGQFSRSVLTSWVELPVSQGIRFSMVPASIAVCAHRARCPPDQRAGADRSHQPVPPGMTGEPSFALAGPDGAVSAHGVHTAFPRIAEARAALSSGQVPIVLGALPFDLSRPTALIYPESVRFTDALPDAARGDLPPVRIVGERPPPDVHRARIVQALRRLADPADDLHKVVLARALALEADAPIDVVALLHRLARDRTASAYLVDLTAAGEAFAGSALIGASPELLVARRGEVVTCRPFAGSAPRSPDHRIDRDNGAALAASAKNLHEHQLVVDQMRDALEPLCVDLRIAPQPELSSTSAVWHLSTPISGRIREKSLTALDLAIALHPTPAVGGVPAAAAAALIDELEGDRRFYAGAVGWCEANGDGKWVVSIRCAEVSADRRTALARAGGGIVAESDPDDEVTETITKFNTILTALGVEK